MPYARCARPQTQHKLVHLQRKLAGASRMDGHDERDEAAWWQAITENATIRKLVSLVEVFEMDASRQVAWREKHGHECSWGTRNVELGSGAGRGGRGRSGSEDEDGRERASTCDDTESHEADMDTDGTGEDTTADDDEQEEESEDNDQGSPNDEYDEDEEEWRRRFERFAPQPE